MPLFLDSNSKKQVFIDTSFVAKVKEMPRPTFRDNTCNIIDYGAEEHSIPKNTLAFKRAITDCVSMGGGVVLVPSGTWITGSIHLKDNINLHITKGATILFSGNPSDYLPVVRTRFIGLELYNYSPVIYAQDCQNIAITGEGIIDGNGQSDEWKPFIKNQKKAIRKLYTMTLINKSVAKRIFGTEDYSLRPSLIQPYNGSLSLMGYPKILKILKR